MKSDLLSDDERRLFAHWLRERITLSGVRKMAIARSLGDDSTSRLNRYIEPKGPAQIPRPHILAKLSRTINVSWVEAFWRAGYYAEVLGLLNFFARAIPRWYNPEHKMLHPERVTLQLFQLELIRFAMIAFPRRDLDALPNATDEPRDSLQEGVREAIRSVVLSLQKYAPVLPDDAATLHTGLDPLLAAAAKNLEDRRIPPKTRRAIAGELVGAWADSVVGSKMADSIRESVRRQRSREVLS